MPESASTCPKSELGNPAGFSAAGLIGVVVMVMMVVVPVMPLQAHSTRNIWAGGIADDPSSD